jgi:hypothetical protein
MHDLCLRTAPGRCWTGRWTSSAPGLLSHQVAQAEQQLEDGVVELV